MSADKRIEIANRIILRMIHSGDFDSFLAIGLHQLALMIAAELEK
tara:strand:- start:7939 stop:8073 length:135 start_codon:yes stop_codon:yes gene_type:complete